MPGQNRGSLSLPFVDSTFLQAYLPLSKAQWSQLFQLCRYSIPRLNSLRAYPQVLATAPHRQVLRFCFISAIRGFHNFLSTSAIFILLPLLLYLAQHFLCTYNRVRVLSATVVLEKELPVTWDLPVKLQLCQEKLPSPHRSLG